MLSAISLRNFVLIDRMDLEPGEGFTALTGETGAGKSIILDALGVALGEAAERRFIRAGHGQASVTLEFALGADHPVWLDLEDNGMDAERQDVLTLKRVIRANGPARGFINDQPVGTALLKRVGSRLVEIHAQHAAAALLRESVHRELLDQFAGHDGELDACAKAWERLQAMRAAADALRESEADRSSRLAALTAEIEALSDLAPMVGEADALASRRTRLMQAERVSVQLGEIKTALTDGDVVGILGRAARQLDQAARLAGYEDSEAGLEARAAAEAFERGLIEVQEGERALAALAVGAVEDPNALEAAEARLFALRAAARRHGVEPDALPAILDTHMAELAALDGIGADLKQTEEAEREALARWHAAAETLTIGRKAAAKRLENAVAAELKPLKLGRTRFRAAISPLADTRIGPSGANAVTFEIETNPGAGFGPLSKVASGGEMARLSLALKCALAGSGPASVLIFDEADQGVGGAVAAAIGERLARLGRDRQVFAITHSPQVAAAGAGQWSVSKTAPRKGLSRTQVNGLDSQGRTEEIARMLAGLEVTPEARAAAERLLEDTCQASPRQKNRSRR
ncbi:MAG: DNA repair protein RecN [Pseudomonadota bacterium]